MTGTDTLHYTLRCLDTGESLSDLEAPLSNPNAKRAAFLRTEYSSQAFSPGPLSDGIYRFAEWLPIRRRLRGSSSPVTYQSARLASHLGISRLYVTFSGYWPEKECHMLTGTFKECEAYSVCARIPDGGRDILVVASAGNTARAFTRVCSENNIPLVVVIPELNLESLWSVGPVTDCVKVVAAGGDSDYADAIALAATIAALPGFTPEGGAKNVARRDGMATTVLSAVEAIGEIPDHYFQAVGSGTGAIAAWESNARLVSSGQFGDRKMRLRVSQNAPFNPIHDAWQSGTRSILPIDDREARKQIAAIGAKVLANRKPPYSLIGGLYDALLDTGGTTRAVTNDEAAAAAQLFALHEGVDISPAAAVAVADLIASVSEGSVGEHDVVMLNITGGGLDLLQKHEDVRPVKPTRIIDREMSRPADVRRIMSEIV